MNKVDLVVDQLVNNGIEIYLQEGKLKARASKGVLTDEYKTLIRSHKGDLIDYLTSYRSVNPAGSGNERLLSSITADLRECDLSFPQQRLWFLDQLEGGSPQYNMSAAFYLRGVFDLPVAENAIGNIIRRHRPLRTTFFEKDGIPMQRVQDTRRFRITQYDLRTLDYAARQNELHSIIEEDCYKTFDLSSDLLVRSSYIYLSDEPEEEQGVFLISMHHIASDGWSVGLFIKEFTDNYQALVQGSSQNITEPDVQYFDYAYWQRYWLAEGLLSSEVNYWSTKLRELPATHSIPLDFPRPTKKTFSGAVLRRVIDSGLHHLLVVSARREKVTPFILLHAALGLVLSRYGSTDDIVIGTPVANRLHSEVESLIGCFINTLPLRVTTNFATFAEYLEHVKQVNLEAQASQDVPFDYLVDHLKVPRSVQHTPIFQIMFTMDTSNQERLVLPELTFSPIERKNVVAKFDLNINVEEEGDGGLVVCWEYDTSIFSEQTVDRLADSFVRVLQFLGGDPDLSTAPDKIALNSIPILSDQEASYLVNALNNTQREFPENVLVHELFEDQVKRFPNNIGLIFEGIEISYGQLNAQANQLAHLLRLEGVGKQSLVGICLHRSVEMVVSMLAILKAGGAYVPLDPDYPASRQQYILQDTNLEYLITESSCAPLITSAVKTKYLNLDLLADRLAQTPVTDINCNDLVVSDSLAYIIYTSGSTGQPKGVMVEHRALVNRLDWMQSTYKMKDGDRVLQKTPYSFDVSVWEFFWTLAYGGTLVLAKPDGHKDPDYLSEIINRDKVTILHFVPSMLDVFLASPSALLGDSVRHVFCSGEALPVESVQKFRKRGYRAALHNLYGPTEAAIDVTSFKCDEINGYRSVPIGKPIQNISLFILDDQLNLCPMGSTGELFIGGVGLARGYLNKPELTEQRFIPHPFSEDSSQRLYRTGDLVRYLPCGNIEYLGRTDNQVKIRGFRIELGEIESRLKECDGIDSCLVTAATGTDGQKFLVAYVRMESDGIGNVATDETLSVVRQSLTTMLPEYMLPSVYIPVDNWPLTTNGKIDRNALPAVDTCLSKDDYIAPQTGLEVKLAEIWSDLFGLEQSRISVNKSFFEIGGHSLLAVKLVSRVRQKLQTEIALRSVFEYPTIRALASQLESVTPVDLPPEIEPRQSESGRYPLTFFQKRIWFLNKLNSLGSEYNMPAAFKVDGKLDIDLLRECITVIIKRHSILRSVYREANDGPYQTVMTADAFSVEYTDLSYLEETEKALQSKHLIKQHAITPFNLESDLMIRVAYVRLSRPDDNSTKGLLLFNMHHIASDGWSLQILVRELSALYTSGLQRLESVLPELPIQYSDFAQWQTEFINRDRLGKQIDYWKKQLSDIPALHGINTDYPRMDEGSPKGRSVKAKLSKSIAAGIAELAELFRITPFMVVHGALALVLSRHSNSQDIVIGTPVANRMQEQLEGLIGGFVNTLVLRLDTSNKKLTEYFAHVRDVHISAQDNQDVPFEELVEQLNVPRSRSHTPVFQIILTTNTSFVSGAEARLDLSGVGAVPLAYDDINAKFDLEIGVDIGEEGIDLDWVYDRRLFTHESIKRIQNHFINLLVGLVDTCRLPQEISVRQISELPLLSQLETEELLVTLNRAETRLLEHSLIHRVFEIQAQRSPDAVALSFGSDRLTYRELDHRANCVAAKLLKLGVSPGTLVGICVDRSFELVTGIVAILKAGGGYVPMDPNYPNSRLEYIIDDCQLKFLVTGEELIARFEQCDMTLIDVAETMSNHAVDHFSAPDVDIDPESAAYVIYTSGSTGNPKGVVQTHQNATRLFSITQPYFEFNERDAWVLFHSVSFDFSVWELWGALFFGGKLVVPDNVTIKDTEKFVRLCLDETVTVLNQTPSAFKTFSEAALASETPLPGLRYVIFGGEAFEPSIVLPWRQAYPDLCVDFINMYGITETTVHASYWKVPQTLPSSSVIGCKLGDQRVYILDRDRNLVPKYATGELYIGGAGLAVGYLNRPDLTGEKFIPNPFSGNLNDRLYRTGDLVRYLPDGNLEYCGRMDDQVKIRGFRIELGEISNHINRTGLFSSCAVVVREDEPGEKYIAAYLVSREDRESAGELLSALKESLGKHLPEYMYPAAYILLDTLPRTTNGKIDKGNLPKPEISDLTEQYVPPRDEMESGLVDVWERILKRDRAEIGVHTSFFDLGGHSLLGVRLVSEIREAFNCDISISKLFELQTVSRLAEFLRAHQTPVTNTTIKPLERNRHDYPLSFHQQRMWFIDRMQESGAAYNIPAFLRVTGKFNIASAQRALADIVERHEVLRSVYSDGESGPVQIINPPSDFFINRIDLTALADNKKEKALEEVISEELQRPFCLDADLMLRCSFIALTENEEQLDGIFVMNMHHIASDGWSLSIIIREFIELYRGYLLGEPVFLEPLPLQYVDYAHWLIGEVGEGRLQDQAGYWTDKLTGLPQVHSLPLDKPRPREQSFNGAIVEFGLDREQVSALKKIAGDSGVTFFMSLHAVFSLLLARYSNENDIVIGVPVANRPNKHLESLVGFFVNTVVLRTDCAVGKSFLDYLQQVKEVNLEAQKNQDLPFQQLLEIINPIRSRSHSPLFQILFSMDNNEQMELAIPDATIKPYEPKQMFAKFDLVLHAKESEDGLRLTFEYSTDIFCETTIAQMADHFKNLVFSVVQQPDQDILALPLVGDRERKHLVHELNRTGDGYPADICMHDLFIKSVMEFPQNVALRDEFGGMTYAELFTEAYAVQQSLSGLGVRCEERVGVRLPKGRGQLIATLGIMMAGGAYLPMEVKWPDERCTRICQKARCRYVISDSELSSGVTNLALSALADGVDRSSDTVEMAACFKTLQTPETLAYVIFTSGSTGEPKGVEIEHHAVVNTLLTINQEYDITEQDAVLAVSALSFDLSVYDLFGLLAVGGTVIFPEDEKATDPGHWLEMVEAHDVTVWDTVPVSASLLVEQLELQGRVGKSRLTSILMSGDWIAPDLPARLWEKFPGCKTYSLGGATEGSIWSIHYPIVQDTTCWKSVPYGKPLHGQRFFILNEAGQLVPRGIRGELYIGGRGVARGYCGDETQTAARFIWHSQLQQKLYRTGDMGRYFPDGNIEFLGRADHQVKLRGFRIELGEIEAQLVALDEVDKAVVMIRGDGESRQIVAYLVLHDKDMDSAAVTPHTKEALQNRLPDYMVPAVYIVMKALPLTSNGKVDYKALPDYDFREHTHQQFVAPANHIESKLCHIWQELLGVKQIGVADNFFELGAHSVLALRLVSQIRETFKTDLPLRTMFEKPTIREIARIIESSAIDTDRNLQRAATSEFPPLSFAQQRLWFINKLNGGTPEYNMPGGFHLRGNVDYKAIKHALREVVQRHEILRTSFREANGKPYQFVHEEFNLPLTEFDFSGLSWKEANQEADRILFEEGEYRFDLENDIPIRFNLIRLPDEHSTLQYNMHHIASDGWSMSIFADEFSELYKAHVEQEEPELPDLPVQYADYAQWQRDYLNDDRVNEDLAYWKERLRAIPLEHNLPLDKPRPAQPSFKGSLLTHTLDKRGTTAVDAACRKHEVTLFMYLQTLFAVMISRFSNEMDIVMGTAVSGRDRLEVEPLVGFFVNSVVLRADTSGNPSFAELLEKNRGHILDAFNHQHIPFDLLVEELNPERTLTHSPVFQIMFVLQNTKASEITLSNLEITPQERVHSDNKFDLHLLVEEVDGELVMDWIYDTDLFDRSSIQQMADSYNVMLNAVLEDSGVPVWNIPLLSNDEKKAISGGATQPDSWQPLCVHQLFERQAEVAPDQIALIYENSEVTYRQLNARANRLARCLVAKGVKVGDLVGLSMKRSPDLIVGLLAILKSGAAYVPLDPAYPDSRLAYMLKDSGAQFIVGYAELIERVGHEQCEVVAVDDVLISEYSDDNLDGPTVTSSDLAYIIYTSGSTGTPKGVMVEHGNITRLFSTSNMLFGFGSSDVWTLYHSYAFDFSVWEIWGALIYGGTLVIVPIETAQSPQQFCDLLKTHRVSVLNQTPSAFYPLNSEILKLSSLDALRFVIFGGEGLQRKKLNGWFDHEISNKTKLINMYGITETTVHVTFYEVARDDQRTGIIGAPLPDLTAVVCNRHFELQPVNVEGELLVAGSGVSRGYLNQPELTSDKFITASFDGGPARRWYRSGDLVKRLNDGNLQYVKRIDSQVKVRGFRIETGEIEYQLQRHQYIEEALVVPQTLSDDAQMLVAYLRPSEQLLQRYDGSKDADSIDSWQGIFDDTYANSKANPHAHSGAGADSGTSASCETNGCETNGSETNGSEANGSSKESNNIEIETDITGWQCSYRNDLIPLAEMQEWVDETVERIRVLQPRRLLEIGVGTGMLLYRYGADCTSITVTDLSQQALEKVQKGVQRKGWDHVEFLHGDAQAISDLTAARFDTVVVNSVVQYFPSEKYFHDMLVKLFDYLEPGGKILLGDIRNFDLLAAFATSVALYQSTEETQSDLVYQHAVSAMQKEEELLFSPSYFSLLPEKMPEIGRVDILVKEGVSMNEMMRYRYDVVLHKSPVKATAVEKWYRWLDKDHLWSHLAEAETAFGVYGYPNRRIESDVRAEKNLKTGIDGNIEQLKESVSSSACDDLRVMTLLARDFGFELKASWNQQSLHKLDLLFVPLDMQDKPVVQPHTVIRKTGLVSAPQLRSLSRHIIPEIKSDLESRLPAFMVPQAYLLLERFPLTDNGKIDKASLPKWVPLDNEDYVEPRDALERSLQVIWQKILNQPKVGVESNFFNLGGHSLLVHRLINEINTSLNVQLRIRDLFERSTIASLAKHMRELDQLARLIVDDCEIPQNATEEVEW